MNRTEVGAVGFDKIAEIGHVEHFVYHKTESISFILERSGLIKQKGVFVTKWTLKEINKSKLSVLYSGPIKNKTELKWLINLK